MAKSRLDPGFDLTNLKCTSKQICCGEYGKIIEVKYYGASFAATEIDSSKMKKGKCLESLLEQEFYQSNRMLCHPNVTQFLGIYYPASERCSKDVPLVVTEMVQENLTSLLETHPNVPIYAKLSILLDVSRGLWYLHSHNPPIVHGDLTSNSIYLTSQLIAKVGNLGFASIAQHDNDGKAAMVIGYSAADFVAPEARPEGLLGTLECGPALDVFSYGGVILHVMNQEWPQPLQDTTLSEIEKRQKHLGNMCGYTTALNQLVETCLQDDPNQRPRMKTVRSKMMNIYEPYSGVDNTLWRMDSAADPAISSGMEKINEVLSTVNDLERVQMQVEQKNDLITSLKVS